MLQFDAVALQTALAITISVAAAITSWKTVLKPIWDRCRARKQAQLEFQKNCLARQETNQKIVIEKLEEIDEKVENTNKRVDDINKMVTSIQRDNLERSHFMFVNEYGYCPSGIKESLSDIYRSYPDKDVDGITKKRLNDILDLPEYPTPG